MEEAKVFKRLMNEAQFDVIELANRVGHSPKFVRGRLKLNDLHTAWQKYFLQNKMNLNTSLRMAKLPKSIQKEWFETE